MLKNTWGAVAHDFFLTKFTDVIIELFRKTKTNQFGAKGNREALQLDGNRGVNVFGLDRWMTSFL